MPYALVLRQRFPRRALPLWVGWGLAVVLRQAAPHPHFSLGPRSQMALGVGVAGVGLSPPRSKGSEARWRPRAVLDPKWAQTSCITPYCFLLQSYC